jgi:hypothetical protein
MRLSNRRLGIGGFVVLIIAIAVWIVLLKDREPAGSVTNGRVSAIPVHAA